MMNDLVNPFFLVVLAMLAMPVTFWLWRILYPPRFVGPKLISTTGLKIYLASMVLIYICIWVLRFYSRLYRS